MKDETKTVLMAGVVISLVMLLYAFGYFAGKDSVVKGVQLESIGDSMRFIYENDTNGIWRSVYINDGSFIGFVVYDIDNSFKTFIHVNETVKSKMGE